MRVSTRSAAPCPTTRKPQVRLSRPQASVVGAHDPAAKRLYEFTFGAKKIASSRPHAIWPARYWRNSSDSPAKTFCPSRHSEEWMWQDDPNQRSCGFAMKVIEQPFKWAISFAPFL